MKKIITVLLVLTFGIIHVNAAGSDPVNKSVKVSFTKEFSTVKDVTWSFVKEQDLFKATFNYNNKQLNAYFTRAGEFIGISRYISIQQLPVMLSKTIQERYSKFQVRTVIESTSNSEISYFVTMDGEKYAQIVKVSSNGDVTQFKKIKKTDGYQL